VAVDRDDLVLAAPCLGQYNPRGLAHTMRGQMVSKARFTAPFLEPISKTILGEGLAISGDQKCFLTGCGRGDGIGYNEARIKMSLGGRSPVEYRKRLGLMT
jgi:hypothetical protein